MPRPLPALAAAAGVASLMLAVPAGASAVTVSLDKRCYTHVPTKGSQPIVMNLAGGTPGARFLVAATIPGRGIGSAGSASGMFDPAGNGVGVIENVSVPGGTISPTKGRSVDLSVQDFGAGGADQPLGQARITNLALSIARQPRSIRRKRTISVSGTPFANRGLSAFIVKGSTSRRVLRRIPLGRANACGFTSAKGYTAPKSFKTGSYRIYINPGTKLDKKRSIWRSFRIFRRYF